LALAATTPPLTRLPITRIADVIVTEGVLVLTTGVIAAGVTLVMRWAGVGWSWGVALLIAAPLALPSDGSLLRASEASRWDSSSSVPVGATATFGREAISQIARGPGATR
jgi:hypothetical protein